MSTWITVHTSLTSQEALIIKAQLELQEIDVNLLDEHATMYTLNFANGSGGVRIQVKDHQVEMAIAFLVENGYMTAASKRSKGLISWLSEASSTIPVLKNWKVEARLIFIVSVIALVAVILLALREA